MCGTGAGPDNGLAGWEWSKNLVPCRALVYIATNSKLFHHLIKGVYVKSEIAKRDEFPSNLQLMDILKTLWNICLMSHCWRGTLGIAKCEVPIFLIFSYFPVVFLFSYLWAIFLKSHSQLLLITSSCDEMRYVFVTTGFWWEIHIIRKL